MTPKARIGLALWLLALSAAGAGMARQDQATRQLLLGLLPQPRRRAIFSAPPALAPGDPVVQRRGEDLRTVGWVTAVRGGEIDLVLERGLEDEIGGPVRVLVVDRSAAWVLEQLVPPERAKELRRDVAQALREDLLPALEAAWPQVARALGEAFTHIAARLPVALDRQQARWDELLAELKAGPYQEVLRPLVRQEILPTIRRLGEPLGRQVAAELWAELPKWDLSWRAAVDTLPLGERRLADERLERFIDQRALPILEAHGDDFAVLAGQVLRELAASAPLRQGGAEFMRRLLADPRATGLLAELFRELVLEDQELHRILRRSAEDERLRAALAPVWDELGRRFYALAVAVLTDPAAGRLRPGAVRVLRARLLGKEPRMLLLDTAEPGATGSAPHLLGRLSAVEDG